MSSGYAAPKRVVYVDDDDDIRQIASLALELNDEISVETCGSGERALELLPDLLPDFILLDYMMPGLDGPATLARIRENPLLAHIPVAFITARAVPRDLEQLRQMGVVGVIPKPFDPMQLAGQVSELWRSSLPAPAAHLAAPIRAADNSLDVSSVRGEDSGAATRAARLEWLLASVLEVQELIDQAGFELDSFMHRVVDVAQSLTGAKGAIIELVDGDEMRYQALSESMRQHAGIRLKRTGSLSGLCVEQARVLTCDESETDPRVDREACRRVGVRSMVCTPLFQDGRPVGVLKVVSDRPQAFGYDVDFLLTMLSGTLGEALGKQPEPRAPRA